MGYTSRERFDYRWYYPSNTAQSSETPEQATASTATMVKLAELTLKNNINSTSRFRFSFWMKCATTGTCEVYLNDVSVGTTQTRTGGYQQKVEDINISIKRGDRIQVYGKTNNAVSPCFVKMLQMQGEFSYFEDTT